MKTKQFGSMLVHRLVEFENLPLAAQWIFPACTPEILARGREWLDGRFIVPDADDVLFSFQSFVVQTGGVNILVDACHGNDKKRDGAMAYYNELKTDYLGNLARLGLAPGDIDFVLCTHLHFDHVGWNTRVENGRWVPTFPNARYLMARADYEHFGAATLDGHDAMHIPSFQDSVLPVVEAGLADFLELDQLDGCDLGPGLTLEAAAGHTPGNVMLNARNAFGAAVMCGDVLHHPIQAMDPTLGILGEFDRDQAEIVRRRLLERCAGTGALIMPAHFAAPTAGRVVSAGDSFRFDFSED